MKQMIRILAIYMASVLVFMFSACQNNNNVPKQEPLKKPDESFLKYGDTNETIVELTKINNSVWVHTSYTEENGSLIPSNGLVVLTDKNLVLIDTPWTELQMESLDKLAHEAFNGTFKSAIISHAHVDRIGGASYLRKKKIPITSLDNVAKKAEEKGFVVPDQISKGDNVTLKIDNTDFEIFYPGEGHTTDNTVVWIEKYNLLFAGCLVKQYGADSLGDITEANLEKWPETIKALQEKYPDTEVVVPGHGQWGDTTLMDYTLELLEE